MKMVNRYKAFLSFRFVDVQKMASRIDSIVACIAVNYKEMG